jgi:hypothetical protein
MDPELKESVEAFENLFNVSIDRLTHTITRTMSKRAPSFKAINKSNPTRVKYWILCGLKVAVDRKLLPLAMEIAAQQEGQGDDRLLAVVTAWVLWYIRRRG